ncbi:MAG TPA: STAS domain-containing protein [Pyrinomonadaceae bacterium]|nr:STAS domain-containing protein [Pyrinomonadaceae bacterium]
MEAESVREGTASEKTAVILAADYLNKLSGERIERECRSRLDEGFTELVLDLSQTDVVNSIGVSILLGVIDSASNAGAKVVFSEVSESTVELFDMLGVSRHAEIVARAPVI